MFKNIPVIVCDECGTQISGTPIHVVGPRFESSATISFGEHTYDLPNHAHFCDLQCFHKHLAKKLGLLTTDPHTTY